MKKSTKETNMTREEWLLAATNLLRPDFIHVGVPIPEIINEIIIQPTTDSMEALTILIQDLLSLCTPLWEDRHKFANARIALGLEGYKVSTQPDSELELRLQSIITELGECPAPTPERNCPHCGARIEELS
jgi:hypothetical protein